MRTPLDGGDVAHCLSRVQNIAPYESGSDVSSASQLMVRLGQSDATIPNYKEGANAFEQRDVEFPAPSGAS